MTVIDVQLKSESKERYLTYALSVVSSRALPDVRDGLKPVQRRILYAMSSDLRLFPEKPHRKSAAVVGEVLAKYHPHGDSACYEAMVRMAQDFSLRYPLVDGQGNFGSLDGDRAAAYRYTETRLTPIALEVLGDLAEETVPERFNFDQTTEEPVVLPSRVPNLLINGSTGIAVGLATAIPPHNLREVVKTLLLLLNDPNVSLAKLLTVVKGPDFPTACSIANTKEELHRIYESGRGAVRMRATYEVEKIERGERQLVITSVPYGADKSVIVEKIADLIISKKLSLLEDVRDESTEVVRIVCLLSASADADKAMSYLYRHTPLQTNFNVNLTALVPTENPMVCRPARLSLKEMLSEFLKFRFTVTAKKLEFEKQKLAERIHLLEGLVIIFDALDEAINLIRASSGRQDAAERLKKRFQLSQEQAAYIVDLRLYQLAQTAMEEVRFELAEKSQRVAEIQRILDSKQLMNELVASDLKRISDEYGDDRKSEVVLAYEEHEIVQEEFVHHEDVNVIVTRDGWLKRIKQTNDPSGTRVREGDAIFFTVSASTRDSLVLFTNVGNVYTTSVYDLVSTSGFGEPVQKLFKFQDGEQIIACRVIATGGSDKASAGKRSAEKASPEKTKLLLYTARGVGFVTEMSADIDTKKTGKRLMRVSEGDRLEGVVELTANMLLFVSERGYGLIIMTSEIPVLAGAGKGVILQRMPDDDSLKIVVPLKKREKCSLILEKGEKKTVDLQALSIGVRAKRGEKLYKGTSRVDRLSQ